MGTPFDIAAGVTVEDGLDVRDFDDDRSVETAPGTEVAAVVPVMGEAVLREEVPGEEVPGEATGGIVVVVNVVEVLVDMRLEGVIAVVEVLVVTERGDCKVAISSAMEGSCYER